MLDSSVLIAGERGRFPLLRFLQALGETDVCVAAVTATELLHGVHRAQDLPTRSRRSAYVEALLRDMPIATFDLLAARRHAELWATLAQAGQMIGPHDLLIAATAVARGDAIATLNTQEFSRVPGLDLVDMTSWR